MAISFTVRANRIPAVKDAIVKNSADNVAEAAASLAARASAMAPRRTGSLSASVYVSGPGNRTNYAESVGTARNLNAGVIIVDEIQPKTVDPKSSETHAVAIVAPAVLHGLFIELGTRYMAPRPFLIPAAEASGPEFTRLMGNVADL